MSVIKKNGTSLNETITLGGLILFYIYLQMFPCVKYFKLNLYFMKNLSPI